LLGGTVLVIWTGFLLVLAWEERASGGPTGGWTLLGIYGVASVGLAIAAAYFLRRGWILFHRPPPTG